MKSPRAELVLYHLTCHYTRIEDDPPPMYAEDDHSHGEVLKFTCVKCHHKVTLDLCVRQA